MSDERETCLIGDVHGCYDEMLELLASINFNPKKIRLIFVGDLVDRGPKSAECVHFVRALCEDGEAECVLGNHESKHVRYRGHEIKKHLTGKDNPMRPMNLIDSEAHKKLNEADVAWLRKLPLKVHIKDNWWALHGGLEPFYAFDRQSPDQIIRCRYVSDGKYTTSTGKVVPRGKAVPLSRDLPGRGYEQPPNTIYWTDGWEGSESIVYGHCVHSLVTPLIDNRPNGVKCVGIDTGCVFGGHLTAFFLERNEFVKVKAHKEYYHLNNVKFDE